MNKVLCLISKSLEKIVIDEEDLWMDLEDYSFRKFEVKEHVMPLYNHPHNDIENGQKEVHYHQDTRYIDIDYSKFKSFKDGRVVLPLAEKEYLEFRFLEQKINIEASSTEKKLISNSKLKRKCIYKGKCPHRGYDLTKEKSFKNKDGIEIIKCPLHSLEFNIETGVLIN